MNFFKKKKNQKIILIVFLALILAIGVFLFFTQGTKEFSAKGEEESELLKPKKLKPQSPFSGIECSNYKNRAFGVILAQYRETMPLSGISEADLVIEWPVANAGGVTRLLAIFQCATPKEVGSVRSARPYLADLAKGFDLVLASWGGPGTLNQRVAANGVDWLNAMENPSGAFFRKRNKRAPHNGFTSLENLKKAARDKKMREENEFESYLFLEEEEIASKKVEQVINVAFSPPVKYVYSGETGNYFRYWNNTEAIDSNNNKKAYAKNVVLLKTTIGILSPGVAEAKIIGSGEVKIYQGGEEIVGTWSKESANSKLAFFNQLGEEIKFIPGPIWIAIVDRF